MKAPLPLEGEGAGGWGGGTPPPVTPEDSGLASPSRDRVNARPSDARASTPPNPPPPGEGFPLVDRFARTPRIKAGGVARARRLRADPTWTEAKLWDRLRHLDPHFRREAPIGPCVVDFACHSAKLVVEVDGGVHNRTDVALRDLKRDHWLTSQGYRVLRIPSKRVETELDAVIDDISKAVGVFVPPGSAPASTPSQPFPLEGKGSSEV